MAVLLEPIPRPQLWVLRRAVLEHAVAEHRRVHPPVLHVGTPGGRECLLAVRDDEPTDHGLRTDVLAAMVRRAGTEGGSGPPLVWLTRTGGLGLQDVDAQWLSAALAAGDEAARDVTFVIVNRHGWRDPRSGLGRGWKRLRRR